MQKQVRLAHLMQVQLVTMQDMLSQTVPQPTQTFLLILLTQAQMTDLHRAAAK
jgi:hypothetical protein